MPRLAQVRNTEFGLPMLDQGHRRLQFNLRSVFALTFVVGALLGLARILGPDALAMVVLLATCAVGTIIGQTWGYAKRGAALGFASPVVYVLSIEVFAHIGGRLVWPGLSLRAWEVYSSLWYGPYTIRSERLWHGYWLWNAWYEDMARRFGTERAPSFGFAFALLSVCGVMLFVRRRHRAAYVLPAGLIASVEAIALTRDFDAALVGLVAGAFGATLLKRRSRDDAPPLDARTTKCA